MKKVQNHNPKKGNVAGKKPVSKSGQGTFLSRHWEKIILVGILLVTLVLYLPILSNLFNNWDDIDYVTANPVIRGLSKANLVYMFTKPVAANYHPLTILSLALNYEVSGLQPAGYFLVNMILHLVNTLLVYLLAVRLLERNKVAALFVAALFAVHPMHVESVAWISERKDLLYAMFFLGGMITWCRYIDRRSIWLYGITFLLFVLSGLSKPSAVVFPFALLLLDYLLQRKFAWPLLLEKTPFLLVSVGIGIATLNAQIGVAVADFGAFSLVQKFLFATYGFVIYIVKLFVPYGLSTLHPFPVLNKSLNLPWLYFIAPVAVLLVIVPVILSARKTRTLLFGLAFYFLNIALTLQFFQVGSAIISERYTYVSYIGLLVMLAWLLNRAPDQFRISKTVVYLAMVLFFGIMTFVAAGRVKVWHDSETLWTDVIEKYPDSFSAFNSRGYYYLKNNMPEKALPDLDRSIELKPDYLDALNNRGSVYRQTGSPRKAIADYNRALSIDPNFVRAISGRGNVYFSLGILDSAMTDFNRALSVEPENSVALANRGAVYFSMGKYDSAVLDCSQAIRIDPMNIDAHMNRGASYSVQQKWEQAIGDYTVILESNPQNVMILEWRGIAYTNIKEYQLALNDFNTGIEVDPKRASLYVNRAVTYLHTRMNDRAAADVDLARQLGSTITLESLKTSMGL